MRIENEESRKYIGNENEFEMNGKLYKAVPFESCSKCAFSRTGCLEAPCCIPLGREDRQRVSFVEVLKLATNGDRIRAMSNWDLAEFIAQNSSCGSCILFDRCGDEECDETWWSWLDSPADNEEMHSCSECNNRDNSCNRSIMQSPFFKDLMEFTEKEFGREAARRMELFALTWHGRNSPAESEGK